MDATGPGGAARPLADCPVLWQKGLKTMPLLILTALLLPLPLAAAHRLGRRFEEAVPLCWSALVVFALLMGMAGVLRWTPLVFLVLTAGAVLYLGWALWKQGDGPARRAMVQKLAGPGFWLFVLAMVLLWWMDRGRRYTNWDEYSHWGRALKGMMQQDVLPCLAAGKDSYRAYPPAPAMFQYLAMKAAGLPFREDVAIFLQSVFALGFLFYPLHCLPRARKGAAVVTAAALFFAPLTLFYHFYVETTVDGLLSVLFAFLIFVWLQGRGRTTELVLLCLASSVLAFTKDSGLAFVLLATAVAGCTVLGYRRRLPLQGPRLAAWLLLPAAAGLVSKMGWSAFLRFHQVPLRWQPEGLTLQGLQDLLHGQPQWRMETIRYFGWNIFCDRNYGWLIHCSYAVFLAVLCLTGVLLYRLMDQTHRRRMGPALLGAGCCAVVYTGATLFTYLFWFDPVEAKILASLSRYLNTCLVALLVLLAAGVGMVLAKRGPRASVAAAGCCAAFWLLASSPDPIPVLKDMIQAPLASAHSQNLERSYTQAAARLKALDPEAQELPVFIVAQQDFGLTNIKLDYELLPAWLPEHTSSIGSPYQEDDIWTQPYTPETWGQELAQHYEYVYLFDVDEKFVQEFGQMFQDPAQIVDGALFRVVPGAQGVALEPME